MTFYLLPPIGVGTTLADRATRTILIVDDDENVRSLLDAILGGVGYQTLTASDGKEALRKLSVITPDMIISDCSMPEMQGDELFRAVKTDPRTQHIPYVVVTGSTGVKAKEERFAGYVDAFLIKPFDADAVVRVADRLLCSLRVLLVEDDPDVREMMSLALARQGFDVRSAADGKAALECLAGFGADVAFVDTNLPQIEGPELVRRMRALPRGSARRLAILMTSGKESLETLPPDVPPLIDGFVGKPYNVGEVADRMRALSGRKEGVER